MINWGYDSTYSTILPWAKRGFLFLLVLTAFFNPWLSTILLAVYAFMLVLKTAALVAGVQWHYQHGEKSLDKLIDAEKQIGDTADGFARRAIVYDELKKTPVKYAPFGTMDFKWLRLSDEKMKSDQFCERVFGYGSQLVRDLSFGYEFQVIAVSLLLFSRPFSTGMVHDLVAQTAGILLLATTLAMGLEILVGNIVMRDRYSHFFHLRLATADADLTSKSRLLRELFNFSRLVFHALVAVTITCMTYYVTHGDRSFKGIDTPIPTGQLLNSLTERFSMFGEFVAFSITTFSTVGYGDVAPDVLGSRLIVAVVHIITVAFVLFVLQILLNLHVKQSD